MKTSHKIVVALAVVAALVGCIVLAATANTGRSSGRGVYNAAKSAHERKQ